VHQRISYAKTLIVFLFTKRAWLVFRGLIFESGLGTFGVLTAVLMKIEKIRMFTPWRLVKSSRSFEATATAGIYQSTRCNNPETW